MYCAPLWYHTGLFFCGKPVAFNGGAGSVRGESQRRAHQSCTGNGNAGELRLLPRRSRQASRIEDPPSADRGALVSQRQLGQLQSSICFPLLPSLSQTPNPVARAPTEARKPLTEHHENSVSCFSSLNCAQTPCSPAPVFSHIPHFNSFLLFPNAKNKANRAFDILSINRLFIIMTLC